MNQKESTEEAVLTLLRSPRGASGLTKNEIARTLSISTEERSALRGTLKSLVDSGTLIEGDGRRLRVRDASQRLLTGSIFIRPGGEGSFRPERWDTENTAVLGSLGVSSDVRISIPATHLAGALNGDVVQVKVSLSSDNATGRSTWNNRGSRNRRDSKSSGPADEPWLDGRIVKILERRNERIPGTLFIRDRHAWVIPDDPLLPNVDLQISSTTEAKAGDKVVVGVDEWPVRGSRLKGHLIQRLGRPGEKGVDILGIIHKFRLPLEFPEAVLREAAAFPDEIPESEIARREDCRQQHIITIDPFDARDFDDAIGVKSLPKGGYELSVHIADVAHYVVPGSALDKEARERGNSTYLVDRVIPMLPERLSNGLCSLRPHEDKLTRFAVLTYDAKGRRTGQRFGSGVIRSSRRYSYEEAMNSLKNPVPGDPDSELLQRAWSLASKLRARRFDNGALDMDFPEIKIILDEHGVPVRLATVVYDESHQLIEEFMLAANAAVAEALLQSGRPAIYRIHEDPDPSKLDDLRQLLGAAGIRTGDLSVRTELQRALAAMAGRAEEPVLKISLLKSLKRAVYHPDSLGHYGLNFEHYTHFTSPIRRYADLIVHRLLWNLGHSRGGAGTMRTPDYAHMKETAEHISTTERVSADAEMESRRLKELEYFEKLASSPDPEPWPCLISRVLPFGLFVETTASQTRGAIRLGDLGWPDPYFDGSSQTLRNRRPAMELKAGDRVNAVPVGIDRERGTVNFRLLDSPSPASSPSPSRKHAKKRDIESGRETKAKNSPSKKQAFQEEPKAPEEKRSSRRGRSGRRQDSQEQNPASESSIKQASHGESQTSEERRPSRRGRSGRRQDSQEQNPASESSIKQASHGESQTPAERRPSRRGRNSRRQDSREQNPASESFEKQASHGESQTSEERRPSRRGRSGRRQDSRQQNPASESSIKQAPPNPAPRRKKRDRKE